MTFVDAVNWIGTGIGVFIFTVMVLAIARGLT